MIEEGKVLNNTWIADKSDKTDQSVLNQVTQCLFNFDFEKCDNLINGWIPQSQYFMTVRFMILASLRRKIMVEESENILTIHKSQEYSNDQEYLLALELPLGLYEYFWGDKIFLPNQKRYKRK